MCQVSAPNNVLLIGGGGHCRSLIDVLESCAIDIAGIVTGVAESRGDVLGYYIVGNDDDLKYLRLKYDHAIVSVGQVTTPDLRLRLYDTVKNLKFNLPVIVSPFSRVSPHANIAEGTVVMHQAMINAGASIGANCIINSKALVEHDCMVDEHSHVAVGAVLCGGVQVGHGSFVGAGAIIKQGVKVGRNCIIGMGAILKSDLADGCRYVS